MSSSPTELETVADPGTPDLEAIEVEQQLRQHLVRVYALMAGALGITAGVAALLAGNDAVVEYIRLHPAGFEVLILFEMIAVAFVSRAVDKLSLGATAIVFFGYSVLNGFTFAVFFTWLPPSSVAEGFAVTALTFGVMAFYGHRTRRDLGALRSFLTMVIIGVALMAAVNLVFGTSVAYWATAYLGVTAFAALTSYHSHAMRELQWEFEDDDSDRCKAMYASALTLYLDFVNIYILFMRAASSRTLRIR